MGTPLLIPGLFANYQHWPYYQIILTVEDAVKNFGTLENPDYRLKTTDEVEVIYSQKGINNLLQRILDPKRLEPIRKFINEQPDAYVNNLTVAIYGGDPQWIPIDLKRSSLKEEIEDNTFEEIAQAYGLIKLNGDESLFVLDGQHRLKALRIAFQNDKSIGKNQIALTLITHIDNEAGKKRTRRLFSIINRYAKPVSLGENILLDEDDLSAIIVRKFIDEYPLFQGKELVALNKTADLKLPRDNNKFTSVIALWSINEMIIDPKKVYPKYVGAKKNLVRIRPEDAVIEEYKNIIFGYWNSFFDCFPNATNFVNNVDVNTRNMGGPFSLRPLGQQVFCEFYLKMKSLNRLNEINIINTIPDDISNEFWHNILFDPIGQRIVGSKSFVRDYIFYHLNLPLTAKQQAALLRNYRKYKQNENAILPNKLIQQ
jgi:DNA sulfur modification protein DndB